MEFEKRGTWAAFSLDDEGMTIREYFAGQALIGFIMRNGWCPEENAKNAVEQADKLLKALYPKEAADGGVKAVVAEIERERERCALIAEDMASDHRAFSTHANRDSSDCAKDLAFALVLEHCARRIREEP